MTQKQFYKSRAWRRARAAFIAKRMAVDGGICQVCGMAPGYIVHHWKIWLDDENCNIPSIALDEGNFRYECLDCHNREQDIRKQRTHGRVVFDVDGTVRPAAGEMAEAGGNLVSPR